MQKIKAFIFVSVLLVFTSANSAFAGAAVKLGLDLNGNHEFSNEVGNINYSEDMDVDSGISFSGEIFNSQNRNFDIGGGITFQLPRTLEDSDAGFNFIPVYGMLRLKLENGSITPYFIGQLGYSLFFGDDDYKEFDADLTGGLYYGLGGGVVVDQKFLIELLYSVSNGTYEVYDEDFDVEYSVISLNFGFYF